MNLCTMSKSSTVLSCLTSVCDDYIKMDLFFRFHSLLSTYLKMKEGWLIEFEEKQSDEHPWITESDEEMNRSMGRMHVIFARRLIFIGHVNFIFLRLFLTFVSSDQPWKIELSNRIRAATYRCSVLFSSFVFQDARLIDGAGHLIQRLNVISTVGFSVDLKVGIWMQSHLFTQRNEPNQWDLIIDRGWPESIWLVEMSKQMFFCLHPSASLLSISIDRLDWIDAHQSGSRWHWNKYSRVVCTEKQSNRMSCKQWTLATATFVLLFLSMWSFINAILLCTSKYLVSFSFQCWPRFSGVLDWWTSSALICTYSCRTQWMDHFKWSESARHIRSPLSIHRNFSTSEIQRLYHIHLFFYLSMVFSF